VDSAVRYLPAPIALMVPISRWFINSISGISESKILGMLYPFQEAGVSEKFVASTGLVSLMFTVYAIL